jgi:glycosyltransferase involved in cell wall biosynthesis
MSKRKLLILANSASGLYHFRLELIERLLSENFSVAFCVPNKAKDFYVQRLEEVGSDYMLSALNRRSINPFTDFKLIKKYKNIIRDFDPDIILTYTVKPNIYGNHAASKFSKPVIMNVTGIGTSMISHSLKSFVKLLYKYACNKANIVFFQNSSNFDLFLQNKLVNRTKAKLIAGSGVNIEKFLPIEKTINDGNIRFLFIGRIMKEKGIEDFFKASQNIIKKYPYAIFQIVGSKEESRYNSNFETKINIEFLGRSEDVRIQIRECDCIINPSYHEGMSNVLLEGAAMGKPLIASNIPGCREIVEDGKNGFLFEVKNAADLENKIIQFIELSEEQKVSMGNYSRLKVEKEFDRKIVVEEYMKAIYSVINAK